MTPETVNTFWFDPSTKEKWFKPDAAFDTALRERFGAAAFAALRGDHDAWAETPRGTLALILLLDQIPRNIHRGDAQAFAGDGKALYLAKSLVASGGDRTLAKDERLFGYLPFEHSEDLADQQRALELIGQLDDAEYLDYAVRHKEVIERFGRFPHRNATLGRANTEEEEAYLTQPGAGF